MKFAHSFLPALAVCALLVAGCGTNSSADDSQSAALGNPVDRAFVAAMIPHHQSAVQMAKIAQRRGKSAFVKRLADDIVRTQTKEIATMRAGDQRLQRAGWSGRVRTSRTGRSLSLVCQSALIDR